MRRPAPHVDRAWKIDSPKSKAHCSFDRFPGWKEFRHAYDEFKEDLIASGTDCYSAQFWIERIRGVEGEWRLEVLGSEHGRKKFMEKSGNGNQN